MNSTPDSSKTDLQRRFRRLRTFSWIAVAIGLASGLLVLAGWILKNPTLVTVFPGFPPMHPSAAMGLILAALTLGLRLRAERDGGIARHARWASLVCAAFLILLGGVKLSGHCPGRNWNSAA